VRSGAWFRYGEAHLGQGREKVRTYLREHPEVVEELRAKIVESPVIAIAAVDGDGAAGAE
jgi:recombination protein RecA